MKQALIVDLYKTVSLEVEKGGSERDYPLLIDLANKVVADLLTRQNLIPFVEHNTITTLIKILIPYTEEVNDGSKSEYTKKHQFNTCSYKIARELVMKFPNNNFEDLKL